MKKISILYFLGSAMLGALLTLLYINYSNTKIDSLPKIDSNHLGFINENTIEKKDVPVTTSCDYNFHRLKGYKYIKPLLFTEPECESEKFTDLKGQIMTFIENGKRSGSLSYCSVFLKNLTTNEWMAINPDMGYHPGSLIKVAVLIAYLRMAESNPNLLNSTIDYAKDNTAYPMVEYKSDSIVLGNRYKIRDLLYYMIANSDNRATVVLENYMNLPIFKKTFSDLGLKELSFSDTSYRINVKTYSSFVNVIYNAGIVSNASSEFAASLLTESTFRDGLMKLLPPEVKVAHKFGEWGNGYEKELHETGIVYVNDNPYILTVMTNGNNWNNLSNILSTVSKTVYDKMTNTNNPI